MRTLLDARSDRRVRPEAAPLPHSQSLVVLLDGITAADYLAHVHDPEPGALGRDLLRVEHRAEPLGDTIHVALTWIGLPPAPEEAAARAGFPLIPEVAAALAAATDARRAA